MRDRLIEPDSAEGQKFTLGAEPQPKATGMAIVCPSFAWHFGHFTILCSARMAPPNMTKPTIGTAARAIPSGRLSATAAPSGNIS
jgi:hypothetical protein